MGYEPDGGSLTACMKEIRDYNEGVAEEERIAGIMADIEPYTSQRWERELEKYMELYVSGMKKAYEAAEEYGLTLIACIPRHYDDQGLTEQLEELIAKGCDEVAVMDYDCGREAEKIRTEAALAEKYGKVLHCILEFQEVGKHGLTEDKTYCNKGLEAARKAWKEVQSTFPDLEIIKDYHWREPVEEMLKRN